MMSFLVFHVLPENVFECKCYPFFIFKLQNGGNAPTGHNADPGRFFTGMLPRWGQYRLLKKLKLFAATKFGEIPKASFCKQQHLNDPLGLL